MFEKNNLSFEEHTRVDHNLWQYVFLLKDMWKKSPKVGVFIVINRNLMDKEYF